VGEIVAIWIKRAKGGVMDPVDEAKLVAGRGIAGNANQGGRRQVTVIDEAAWSDACRDLGINVPPSARRANVMVRGLDLEQTRGRILQLGSCRIRIWTETTPCYQMDQAQEGLRAALKPHWRAGVNGEILDDGVIRVGDEAELLAG
jgi:MOSC domain-containing protein YiiM